jgi:hypothetical protein
MKITRLSRLLSGVVIASVFILGPMAAAQQNTGTSPKILVGPNIRASSNDTAAKGGRNECWISASRTDPKFLIGVSQTSAGPNADVLDAGAMRNCATMISRSGGQSWREVNLPNAPTVGCFDIMTASAPDGRIYVSEPVIGANFGLGLGSSASTAKGSIKMFSTTDEGKTWEGPGDVACPMAEDHPRIVVDDSDGPHRGRLYIEWNEVYDSVLKNRFNMFLQYSDDHGKTFNDAILVATAVAKGGKLVATEPVVLSDGTLLVTYYQYFNPLSDPKNDAEPFYIVRSTDGAKTLSDPVKVFTVGSSAWRYLRGDFAHAFTLPIVTADTSKLSRFRDQIYVVWQDVSQGEADIWFVKSSDKGASWSSPKRINDNAPTAKGGPVDYREIPVVATNKDGVIGIAWYDYRDDPTHTCWKQYFSASLDGGQTFLPNVAVSSQPSCPAKGSLSPSVYVWNTSPYFDDTLPSLDENNEETSLESLQFEQELSLKRALRDEGAKIGKPRIDVTFDHDRNLWPGHYTGLTADSNGVFHALWSDRRNAPVQQLFTATIEIGNGADPAPATHETDVTKLVQLVGETATYNAGTHETTFEMQLRNISDQTIYGPLRVRITGIGAYSGHPTAVIVNADGGTKEPSWDFSKLLGWSGRLGPGMASEAKKVVVRTSEETGLDADINFEVMGQVAQ